MSANPIKLPVVITVLGDQAAAGLNKLGTQLKNLDAGIGKYLGAQASAVGGMLAGFFTVQSLINGVQKVLEHGQAVIDRVSQFSGEALSAQARLDAAALRQDVVLGSVLGPEIAEEAQKQQQLLPVTGAVDAFTAQLKLELNSAFLHAKAQLGRALEGDFEGFEEAGTNKLKEQLGFFAPETFTPDALFEAEERLRMAQTIMPLPVAAQGGSPSEQDAQNFAVINELKEQVRQLRAINRTVGAN